MFHSFDHKYVAFILPILFAITPVHPQFVTLEILVELLQKERHITIERLATLFPQPILFESRRRNLQRFLSLPQLTPKALWFPIVRQWIKRQIPRGQTLQIVLERTQWQDHNLFMVSLVYQKRAIPLYWRWLDKQGQSCFSDQQNVLRPVFRLLKKHRFVLLADREFHSIELAAWCVEMNVSFIFRLPKSTTVQPADCMMFTRLDDLPQAPGFSEQYLQVQVSQKQCCFITTQDSVLNPRLRTLNLAATTLKNVAQLRSASLPCSF